MRRNSAIANSEHGITRHEVDTTNEYINKKTIRILTRPPRYITPCCVA